MPINPFPRLVTRQQVLPSGYMPFTFNNGKIIPNPVVSVDTALKNSDIFAVVSLISSQLASIHYEIPEPYNTLFYQPNNKINAYGFWTAVINQMLLTGNAYVVMTRNQGNIPIALEQVPYENVEIILDDYSENMAYQISYNDDRQTEVLPAADVLHFRNFVSGQALYQYIGTSPLLALTPELSQQKLSSQLSLSTLKNYIAPSYTITVPEAQLSPEAKEITRENFQKQNEGENQGKAIVLDQSATLGTMPKIDAKTAEYLNNIDWTRTQIAKAFGIPENYLNGQGDQQSSLEQTTGLFVSSFNRYINPFVSELDMKWQTTIGTDLDPIVDPTGSKYAEMITKLAAGKPPILDAKTVLALLSRKGVI